MWNIIDSVTWVGLEPNQQFDYWSERHGVNSQMRSELDDKSRSILTLSYATSASIKAFWLSPLGQFTKTFILFWLPLRLFIKNPIDRVKSIYYRKTFRVRHWLWMMRALYVESKRSVADALDIIEF